MEDFNRSAKIGNVVNLDLDAMSAVNYIPPKPPVNLETLPTDPESLANRLADEPALFAYWQATAEEYRCALERLKNQRDLCKATAYLNAKGTVDERKNAAAADPDSADITRDIETVEHSYRQCLNEMTASDTRMTAIKKILSWRMTEAETISLGEQPTRRMIAGNQISNVSR